MIFRFDDVCANTDMEHLGEMSNLLHKRFPEAKIQYAVSLLINHNGRQFVFDPIMKAYSDPAVFFRVDAFAWPAELPDYGEILSHGLVHVNHRELSRDAQEMSIVTSCSLLGANTFVPPFNKWNSDTEAVCKKHDIHLQRFEDGWLSMEHSCLWMKQCKRWYLHSRNMTLEQVRIWVKA